MTRQLPLAMPDDPRPDASPGWERALLRRLERLCALEEAHHASLNDDGRRMIRRAIFSTFLECRDEGLGQDASSLLNTRGAA